MERQQRVLEDERLARQTDKHQHSRELEDKIAKLTRDYENKLASYASSQTHPHEKAETGTRPKNNHTGASRPNILDFLHEDVEEENCDGASASIPTYTKAQSDANEKRSSNPFKYSTKFESSQQQDQQKLNSSFSVFRLPKLDLQPFDGDSRKWADFFAIFKDLVHDNSTISKTQKMAILKQCLTQDIRDGLGDSLSSQALYDTALQELEETYGHPQLVSRSYIQTLINLPKVNMNDYKSLLKASQSINGSVASLKSGGREQELQSVTLMELVNSKMPSDIQSRWGKNISKNHPRCLICKTSPNGYTQSSKAK